MMTEAAKEFYNTELKPEHNYILIFQNRLSTHDIYD